MNFITALDAIYHRLDIHTLSILDELNTTISNKIDKNTFRIEINNYEQRALVYNYLTLLGYNICYSKRGLLEINLHKDLN